LGALEDRTAPAVGGLLSAFAHPLEAPAAALPSVSLPAPAATPVAAAENDLGAVLHTVTAPLTPADGPGVRLHVELAVPPLAGATVDAAAGSTAAAPATLTLTLAADAAPAAGPGPLLHVGVGATASSGGTQGVELGASVQSDVGGAAPAGAGVTAGASPGGQIH
jgi:hypothetical protein